MTVGGLSRWRGFEGVGARTEDMLRLTDISCAVITGLQWIFEMEMGLREDTLGK